MVKILIVEDDPAILDSLQLIFDSSMYKLTIYPNADPILRNEFDLPDIFILDKQLPGVDGLDVCRLLKKNSITRSIPVIMLSASPNIKILAKQAGADGTLEKPFQVKVLRQMVNDYTGL